MKIPEIPPATVRLGGFNLPIGGGGYFRLLPSSTRLALSLSRRDPHIGATILYFHPWEFDPDEPRLPLGRRGSDLNLRGCKAYPVPAVATLVRVFLLCAADLVGELQEYRARLPRFRPAT